MNNIRTTNHLSLLAFAILVAVLSAGVYAYLGRAVRLSAVRADLSKSVVAMERAGKDRGEDLIALYEETAASRAELRKLFIPPSGEVSFIEAVEAIGRLSGAEISLSSVSAEQPGKAGKAGSGTGAVRAKVEARGGWSSAMRALTLAEALPCDVIVDGVRLDLSAGQGGKGGVSVWNLSFDIRAAMILAATTTPS